MTETTPHTATLELPNKTLLSRILFIPYSIVFLSILCFWDICLKLGTLVAPRTYETMNYGLNYTIKQSLRLLGTTYSLSGDLDNIPESPIIVVSNHQSMFDIPVISSTLRALNLRYVAKKELSKWIPSISFNLRYNKSALIDRGNSSQALEEITRLAQDMERYNFSSVIFPEGTRSRDGQLKKFKTSRLIDISKRITRGYYSSHSDR